MNHPNRYILSLGLLAGILTFTAGSVAQDAPDAPDAPDAAAEAPEAVDNGLTVTNGIRMNFRDVPLETVLDHLSEAVGLVIVKDVDIEGRITVISRQSLTMDEAIAVLNSVLHGKGYAAVRTGRTLRIVTQDAARRANIPVRVGNKPDEIAETDEVITQVIPIRHADARQLVEDLSGIIAETADITANQSSNAMIITDTSANIRRIVEVVAAVDTAISSVATVEVFPLQFANATDAAQLINDIFSDEARQGDDDPRRRFAQMFGRGGPGGRGGDDEEGGSAVDARVSASADERTNTVVVTGPEETLQVVADVLAELDANPMASQGVFVYAVRNGQAVNLQSVLQTLFDPDRDNASAGTQATGRRQRRGQGPDAEQPQQQQQAQQPERDGGGGGGPGGRFREMMERLSGDAEDSAADLLGQVDIVADEDTNSLLVMTAPANFDEVRRIIEELDRPVPQVVIKALIAEITHSDSLDLGAEFTILDIPQGSSLFTDFGLDMATGGITYRLLETDIEATIRALEEVGQLEVLSRPYILASNNQEAIITVGSEIPIPTSSTFSDIGVGSRTNFSYEDIGIILSVTPHINPDGKVIMDVYPEISALSPERVEISEGFFPPVINKRSAETRVAINDGQTIVIGGLMEDQYNETVSKVPLLGDIPLLGAIFRRQETEKSKTELLIFLTPQVATDSERLREISDDERGRVKIIPDAVDGAYQRYVDDLEAWDPSRVQPIEEEIDEADDSLDADADLEATETFPAE